MSSSAASAAPAPALSAAKIAQGEAFKILLGLPRSADPTCEPRIKLGQRPAAKPAQGVAKPAQGVAKPPRDVAKTAHGVAKPKRHKWYQQQALFSSSDAADFSPLVRNPYAAVVSGPPSNVSGPGPRRLVFPK